MQANGSDGSGNVFINTQNAYRTHTIFMSYDDVTYNLNGSYANTGRNPAGKGGLGGARYETSCNQKRMFPGAGAAGIFILRFLTSGNTYVTTGATATTDGDYTVLTWTSGTRTLKFT